MQKQLLHKKIVIIVKSIQSHYLHILNDCKLHLVDFLKTIKKRNKMKRVTLLNLKRILNFKSGTIVSLLISACLSVGNYQFVNAQETKSQAFINNATIEEQFTQVVDKSSKWENHKVVLESWLTGLRRNALDTLKTSKQEIANQKALVKEKEITIDTLNVKLKTTQEELVTALEARNSFSVLGINTSKGVFLTVTWLIILSLAAFSIVALGLYRRSFSVIQKTKEDLDKITAEFDIYRQDTRKKQEQLVIQHHKEMQKLKGG
jgi:hypothetical protein